MADVLIDALSAGAVGTTIVPADLVEIEHDPTGTPASKKATITQLLSVRVPTAADFGGRLTLETAVPDSTTDQTGKTHLYYTPDAHNRAPKWNGTNWEQSTFSEYDLSGPTLTSGKNYDVFWDGSALSLSSAWTNDTTRADALSTQDGIPCLSSDHTKIHVGLIRASGSNTMEDSITKGYVVNRYNRRRRRQQGGNSSTNQSTSSGTISTIDSALDANILICEAGRQEIRVNGYFTGPVSACDANIGVQLDSGTDYARTYPLEMGSGNHMMVSQVQELPMAIGYHVLHMRWSVAAGGTPLQLDAASRGSIGASAFLDFVQLR